jgi:uncharacterized protein (DUF697 family)
MMKLLMKLFRRESRWDRIMKTVTSATSRGGVREAGKVTAGVVGGAVAATVASAVVSAARDRDGEA